jgi:hypothetical protein
MIRLAKTLGLPALAYTVLAVALTWPLVRHLGTHLPHDLGDPLFSSWILWWHAHHIPFTDAWWVGTGYFPFHASLALSDHRVGLSLLTTPIIRLGGNPVFAYNVALLGSFVFSAVAIFALVLALTRRYDAAALAGVVFGFAPYRLGHVEHLEIVSSYWMPCALLGLHLWLRGRETKWLVLFGLSWVMQALTCGHYLFYFSIFLCLWALWFLRPCRRDLVPVALAGAVGLALILPELLHYRAVHDALALRRDVREIELFSADVTGLLSGIPWLRGSSFSGALFRPEGQIFPGFVPVLLVWLVAVTSLRGSRQGSLGTARRVLLGLALVAMCVAASVPVFGAWRFAWGPISVSVSQAFKPLSISFLAFVAYGLLSPAFLEAYRRRSVFVFYSVATLAMWTLALGPSPRLLGHRVMYKAPYAWLMALPGFQDVLRVPARFAMLATLCLAVASGLALARLVNRRVFATAMRISAIVVVLAVAEVWTNEFPLVPAPLPLALPPVASNDIAVVELPLGDVERDTIAMYHSITHGWPVLNGYGAHQPPHYALLRLALRLKDGRALDGIRRQTALMIAIHKQEDRDDEWEQYVRSLPDVRVMERSGDLAFYLAQKVAAGPAPNLQQSGLPIRTVSASEAMDSAGLLRDGRIDTWWATPKPQRGGEQIIVELDAVQDVCGIGLALGPMIGGFPRELEIATSSEGEVWTPAWQGNTAGLAVEAAILDAKRVDVRIDSPRLAGVRFVRLRQLGKDEEHLWAIAELTIRACAASQK